MRTTIQQMALAIGFMTSMALSLYGETTHLFQLTPKCEVDAAEDPSKTSQWIPSAGALFPQLKADPRQPRMSLGLRMDDTTFQTNVGSANLGGDLPIWLGRGVGYFDELQFGLQAAVWGLFNMKSTSMEFINSDWYAGLPVYARIGDMRWRLRVYHISSHLGDEYMLTNHITNQTRKNPSMEAADLTLYAPLWGEQLFGYATIGSVLASDESFPMRHLYINAGAEFYWGFWRWDNYNLQAEPYAAIHTMWWENHNFEPDVNVALGFTWSDKRSGRHQMATSLEYYVGHSQDGQFSKARSQYAFVQLTVIP